jgi:hypothetical protein
MKDLTKYIDSLVEGNVDNYEINFKDGVYVVTIIIDISNRTYPEYLLVEMLGVSRRDRARKMLSRYLPKNLFAVDHKVVGQEINVKLTYPDDIRISGYVDMDDIQPLNIGDNIHMRVDPCININDISTFVTYDPL